MLVGGVVAGRGTPGEGDLVKVVVTGASVLEAFRPRGEIEERKWAG